MFSRYQLISKIASFIAICSILVSGFQPVKVAAQTVGDGLKRQVNAESGRVNFISPDSGHPLPADKALGTFIRPQNPSLALPNYPAPGYALTDTNILVNTTADELNNNGNCSLREAVQAANTNIVVDACTAGGAGTDIVHFSVAGTITLVSQLSVTAGSPLVLNGSGAVTIKGGNNIRAFYVNNGADLTLESLSITEGSADAGGGIYNSGSLTMLNSVLSNNYSVGPYGYSIGGAGIYNTGTLTITNSLLAANYSFDHIGGAIYNLGQVTITNSEISGNGAAQDGGAIYNQGTLTVVDSALDDNYVNYNGGGIYNSGTVSLVNSTLAGNSALYGGGIHNGGTATIVNSTFSGNEAANDGGGIYNQGSGSMILANSTITDNHAGSGGGVRGDGLGLSLRNTILAGNSAKFNSPDCAVNDAHSDGYNLVGNNDFCYFSAATGDKIGTSVNPINPLLGPLQDNGGSTFTHALLAGSPAIDTGNPATPGSGGSACESTDQRGLSRPQGAHCDIGAYELAQYSIAGNAGVAGVTLSYTDGTVKTVTADGSGNYTITVPSGWSGVVTPSLASDVFCPASQTYNNVQANQPAQNYAHTPCAQYNGLGLWTSDFSYYPQGWRADLHPRVLGDVNGDGKEDAIGFGYGGVLVGLSNGSGFETATRWTEDFSYNQGWRMDTYPRLVGDVNGDGKADIVGFGYAGAVVALSNGTSFAPLSLWTSDFSYYPQGWRADLHPRVLGDVNGDGKDDIVGFGYGGVLVGLSNGSGFETATRWTEDFSYNQGWRMDLYPRLVGDVNGDGKADLVGFGYSGAVVALSTGSSFAPLSLWTSDFSYYPQGWRANMHPRELGDVNGDGRADIIGFGYGGVLIGLSNGQGFGLISSGTSDFSYNQGWRMELYPRMVGDVNGDGKADLVGFGYAGAVVATAK